MSKDNIKQIINTTTVDPSKEPLFFGKPLGFQRYDNPKYQQIEEFYENQMLMFWRPNEIDLTKDKGDFESLTEQEKFIFTKNLGYQILLDSIQSRGILHLLEDCSNLEFESFCETWAFFEQIHSRSYTHIIKNVYPNPSKVFDEIAKDEEIIKRASSVTQYYDSLINNIGDETEYDRKKKLYLTIVSIQILEFVRFYISFACSYYFAEKGKMMGNAQIIKLINRDENCFSDDTEVLTDKGWKLFKDLDKSELVAQYNDGKLQFVKPLDYIVQDFKGEMIEIKNNSHQCLVTPNHDMLLWNKHNGYHKAKAKDVKFNYTKSVPHSAILDGDGESNLKPIHRLKIALQADGHNKKWTDKDGNVKFRGKDGGYSHGIYISRQRKIDELDYLLETCGLEFKKELSSQKGKSDGFEYSIKLDEFGYDSKQLNFLYELDLNLETCKDIVDEVIKWDGSIRNDSDSNVYCTTDKRCSDIFQDIAIRAGYKTHIIKSEDNRKESYKTYYRVSILKKRMVGSQSYKKSEVDYDGKVYCVTVPSGAIITRRNDRTMIAGNCHGSFTRFIIKKLNTVPSEGFKEVAKDCEPLVYKMWEDAANEEIEWAKYLFKDGDLIGLNADILTKYMKYLTNLRMKNCGLKPIFETTKNPITWINKYVGSDNVQVAPQETDITSYLSNSLDGNVGDVSDLLEDF